MGRIKKKEKKKGDENSPFEISFEAIFEGCFRQTLNFQKGIFYFPTAFDNKFSVFGVGFHVVCV